MAVVYDSSKTALLKHSKKNCVSEGPKLLGLFKQNKVLKVPEIFHESMLPNLPFKEVYDDSDKTGKKFLTFKHLPISINKPNT